MVTQGHRGAAVAIEHQHRQNRTQAAAWAWWLFGKALLRDSQLRLARGAFEAMQAFIPRQLEPSEEAALSAIGLAQVWEDSGEEVAAEAQFLLAAYVYSKLDSATGSAGCYAQLGFLLHESGRLEYAVPPLRTALELLDPGFAPSLAARLWLALAEIQTILDDDGAAAESLHQARALYRLAPSAAEDLDRTWREARIALAAGAEGRAEALLDRVRRELLERGSVAEAARCTYEQLLVQLETRRYAAAGELTAALEGAFPGAAGEVVERMTALARLAASEPAGQGFYGWSLDLRRRCCDRPGRSPTGCCATAASSRTRSAPRRIGRRGPWETALPSGYRGRSARAGPPAPFSTTGRERRGLVRRASSTRRPRRPW